MVYAQVFDRHMKFWMKISMLATNFYYYGTAFSLAASTEAFRSEWIARLNLFNWLLCSPETCWQLMEFEDGVASGLEMVSIALAH